MAKQKQKYTQDLNTFLELFDNRSIDNNVELNSFKNMQLNTLLSESLSFSDFKKKMGKLQTKQESLNDEFLNEAVSIREKKLLQQIEEDKKVGSKDKDNATLKLALAQGVGIVREVTTEVVDFFVIKSRSVTNNIRLNQFHQITSQSLNLGSSLLIHPYLFGVQLTSIGIGQIAKNAREREDLRQKNEQNEFDRRALGDLRVNGGR